MASALKRKGHLFRKYVFLFATLVTGVMLASGLMEIYFSYKENKAALVRIQREKALAAASKIGQFVEQIKRQISWIAPSSWTTRTTNPNQWRIDFLRLLRKVPAITEVRYLDSAGREKMHISRLAMDIVGSEADFSQDPRFSEAKANETYFGPVYFRKGSEPYISIAISGRRNNSGVTVAEVNLKFVGEVISQIKMGKAGRAYATDSKGDLIAHPDISLVLKKTNFSSLQQVMAARVYSPKQNEWQREVSVAKDFKGQNVLTTYTSISPLGWFVFLEQPLAEAFEPLHASIYRTALLLLIGIVLSVIASLVLARRMVKPIRALQEKATLVGAGEFDHRIEIHTGDELESLGEEFNRMATGLKEREQMRQSLFLAREVQQNLLPAANPQIEGLDIAGSSIYCDETGGDYYDFIINDANENAQIGIAIGDVSGHGISSALLMAAVRSSLRQRSSLPGGAANIISDVNRQLVHDVEDSGQFVTMFYLTVDPIKMHLQYVRAGHDPAIFYDPNTDAFEELSGTGMALGVDKNWNVKAYTKTALKNGQLIFLSTDGVWETRNLQGEMFGKEPIYDIIRKNSSLSANEILNATVESLKNFQNGAKIEDDITLVIIKITD